jgi:hypothetical protein
VGCVVVVVVVAAPETVSVVAHGHLAAHVLPFGAAAVVSFVPRGAAAATVARNAIVEVELGVPGAPRAGTVHVMVFALVSRVRPCWRAPFE